MQKIAEIYVLSFLLSLSASEAVVITEIMYDPESSNRTEWIEIYSNANVNISGWKFFEGNTNHGLTLVNGSWEVNGYAIIAENALNFLSDYPGFQGNLFDSSFSLSNTGEHLEIRRNSSSSGMEDSLFYLSAWGGGNGYSVEKIDPSGRSNDSSNWGTGLEIRGTPEREKFKPKHPFSGIEKRKS